MSQNFKLSEKFLEVYKIEEPDWGPLGEFVFYRTYSRMLEDRNERWWETVRRVVEGTFTVQKKHCLTLRLPWKNDKAQRSAQIMYEKIFHMKFLPPGRGLWMMGTNFIYERGGMALNNCGFVSTSDIRYRGVRPFLFVMDALMNGVGMGFDTEGAGYVTLQKPMPYSKHKLVIPDSREGWVDSVGYVLNAYFTGSEIPWFNYSKIRAHGEPIRGFGGIASGPEPLKELHEMLVEFLEVRVGLNLSSSDIVDIMNMIGKCVVAGNVRRSAEIAIGQPDDEAYVTMKDPVFERELKGWRWASNNSVFATVGMDYSEVVKGIAKNGEPGLVWLDNIQQYGRFADNGNGRKDLLARGVNPCGEQALESFELCCLVETFPSRHENYEEYRHTLKYAYMYAKTVTLLPTHWEETNQVLMKNRRIGTSQSGIIDAFVKHGRREMLTWCNRGYEYLQKLDAIYSDWFCVPRSIRITSVKPSGTVSNLPGVSPGIHYPHAEYYMRRVRVSAVSPLISIMEKAGYGVFQDHTQADTKIIVFPVHEKNFSKRKEDVSIWEQVINAVDYQRYWSDNNVSITVTFNRDEANELIPVLEAFEDKLKAISFLPLAEHGYSDAPFETIDEKEYEQLQRYLTKPDFSTLLSAPEGSKYCDNDSCEI